MMRDEGRRERRSSGVSTSAGRTRRRSETPAVEVLEGRQLLSVYNGPTSSRPVASRGTIFTVTVSGGGYETIRKTKGGQFKINLFATNPNSTLTITAQPRQARFGNTPLQISQLNVKTGLIGTINAGAADLNGPMTSIDGAVSSIQFHKIGRSATVNVSGDVGGLSASQIDLGPTGLVRVGGNLTGPVSGEIHLDGGQFVVGGDATGSLSPGDLLVEHGGILSIGKDLTGGINIAGDLTATTNGLVKVGGNLGSLNLGKGLSLSTGGRLIVGGNVSGTGKVGDAINITDGGLFAVDRDFTGGLAVGGNLALGAGGAFLIGRDLGATTIGGDVALANGESRFLVRGNLNGLKVTGALRGKGSSTSTDLVVGLDLNNLQVLGGGANEGGIQNANIEVGKNIVGLNVAHGIFHSLVTAGVLIDGQGDATDQGATVGADGVDAVLDSQISAGVEIRNITFGGDVRSDFVTNPATATGYPTRILAGVDRAGHYLTGGQIDNFQITGALIDSVLAASVAPNGGDGTLPPAGYGPPPVPNGDPGDGTYDAPAGVIFGGSVSAPTPYINYSEITYFNETFKEVSYNTTIDPTIDDFILPGAINASFASPPLTQAQLTDPNVTSQTSTSSAGGGTVIIGSTTLNLPLPTKSTVLGGVVSHAHGDSKDFAGIFAADTRGVFVGTLPDN